MVLEGMAPPDPPLVPGAAAAAVVDGPPPEPGAAAVGAGMFWFGIGQGGSHGSAAIHIHFTLPINIMKGLDANKSKIIFFFFCSIDSNYK